MLLYAHFVIAGHICDMIKGNESDVGNIDFELQTKTGDVLLCFTLFFTLKNCSYLQPDVQLRWGLNQDVAF